MELQFTIQFSLAFLLFFHNQKLQKQLIKLQSEIFLEGFSIIKKKNTAQTSHDDLSSDFYSFF